VEFCFPAEVWSLRVESACQSVPRCVVFFFRWRRFDLSSSSFFVFFCFFPVSVEGRVCGGIRYSASWWKAERGFERTPVFSL
jgi:hypothetical protein